MNLRDNLIVEFEAEANRLIELGNLTEEIERDSFNCQVDYMYVEFENKDDDDDSLNMDNLYDIQEILENLDYDLIQAYIKATLYLENLEEEK